MIGIYKIENTVNGKVYVGLSIDINSRWAHHKSALRHNKHDNIKLQNAWNHYGEKVFRFSTIEECKEESLSDREIYWIAYYDSYKNGYNMTLGGEGASFENPMLQFTLDGMFVKEWRNGLQAERELNINASGIYGCANKKFTNSGGYIWIFKNEYTKEILNWYLSNQKTKHVFQYDLYGNFIKEWNSVGEIKKELGYSVSPCLSHKNLSCNGYIWKFYDDFTELTEEYCYKVRNILKLINCKPFLQIGYNKQIIKKYNTLKEAVEDGYSEKMVNDCIRGLKDKHKNYLWKYECDYNSLTIEECNIILSASIERKSYSIRQYDLNHNFIKEYDYLSDIDKEGYFISTNVKMCCDGRKPQYKGFIWEFGEEKPLKNTRTVFQFDLNKNLIKKFSSVVEASKETGISRASIGMNCRKQTKTAGGYIWTYEETE